MDFEGEWPTPVGCTHIQKCHRSSCHERTARRDEFHGENHFYLLKFRSSSVILAPKNIFTFSLHSTGRNKQPNSVSHEFLYRIRFRSKGASSVLANLFLRNVAYWIFSLIAFEKVEEKGGKSLISEITENKVFLTKTKRFSPWNWPLRAIP